MSLPQQNNGEIALKQPTPPPRGDLCKVQVVRWMRAAFLPSFSLGQQPRVQKMTRVNSGCRQQAGRPFFYFFRVPSNDPDCRKFQSWAVVCVCGKKSVKVRGQQRWGLNPGYYAWQQVSFFTCSQSTGLKPRPSVFLINPVIPSWASSSPRTLPHPLSPGHTSPWSPWYVYPSYIWRLARSHCGDLKPQNSRGWGRKTKS